MNHLASYAVSVLTISLFSGDVLCQDDPQCICWEPLPAGGYLRGPHEMGSTGDGSGRFFAAESDGTIWIFQDGERLPQPFLDLTEWGPLGTTMLSFTFHPNYDENGRFFGFYARYNEDGVDITVGELSRDESDPNRLDPSSVREIYVIPEPMEYHNGGGLVFGDDGYLYAGFGDGTILGDYNDNGQNTSTPRATIIRIDVDCGEDPYCIPPDNPYLGDPDVLPEIYAIGVRQPYTMTKDWGNRETGEGSGRIFMADCGASAYEEINQILPGMNYGWSGREGIDCYKLELCGNTGRDPDGVRQFLSGCYKMELCGNIEPEMFPIAYYDHTVALDGNGPCVIGGHVYRGCEFPDFEGWYFFGDYGQGSIWRLIELEAGEWDWRRLETCGPDVCTDGLLDYHPGTLFSFGLDDFGEIYFSSKVYGNGYDGFIYKIVDPNNRQQPCTEPPPRYPSQRKVKVK